MPDIADRIEIRELRIVTRCGVLQLERDQAQPFQFDIDIYVDLRRPGATDDLANTVNYGTVCDELRATLESEQHLLLERMSQRAAEVILANPLVDEVTVTVAKLRPPIAADVGTTGVRIHRRRGESTEA